MGRALLRRRPSVGMLRRGNLHKRGRWHLSILAWILLGVGAGWRAGQSLRRWLWPDWRHRAGIVAALVGGFLCSTRLGIDVTGFSPSSINIAFVGAVIPIALGLGFTVASAGASSTAS